MTKGSTHVNLIFDVVKSFKNKLSDEEILTKLKEGVKNIDPKYNIVATIEYSFTE
jgi:hypothetical protein